MIGPAFMIASRRFVVCGRSGVAGAAPCAKRGVAVATRASSGRRRFIPLLRCMIRFAGCRCNIRSRDSAGACSVQTKFRAVTFNCEWPLSEAAVANRATDAEDVGGTGFRIKLYVVRAAAPSVAFVGQEIVHLIRLVATDAEIAQRHVNVGMVPREGVEVHGHENDVVPRGGRLAVEK